MQASTSTSSSRLSIYNIQVSLRIDFLLIGQRFKGWKN